MRGRNSRILRLAVFLSGCVVHEVARGNCWDEAGAKYAVEPELLQAIAMVESGMRPDAININKNGSRDIGLMQINSIHMPSLQRKGITEQRLLAEPCLAVHVGASILAEFFTRHGYNWSAVGAYNAGSAANREALRLRYARKVWRLYQQLITDGLPNLIE
jgi:soluble lytic murein transglycosylase-like protein